MKNFICFSKQFFLQNDFIDTKNAVLTGRPNFSCSITGNYPIKSPQKMQKLFKTIFFKLFPRSGRKQLESPADFFWQPPELFPLDIQRRTLCKFCKKFSFENFHWNRESSFDNPATFFLQNLVKKIAQCPKMKKKLKIKVFFVKVLFWIRRMQF